MALPVESICILPRKFMTMFAEGLAAINSSECDWRPVDIFSGCHWLQVPWICASRISARVIKFQAVWDWSTKKFISKSVDRDPSAIVSDVCIAVAADTLSPVPAFAGIVYKDASDESVNSGRPFLSSWHILFS
jgi:hypothetical protein